MPCQEIVQAIAWSKKSVGVHIFPVKAYVTLHVGAADADPSQASTRDFCQYAVGSVVAVDAPTPHLAGDLKLYMNNDKFPDVDEGMRLPPNSTLGVQIFPDGTVFSQQKLNGNPVGGMPPIKRATTCVQ